MKNMHNLGFRMFSLKKKIGDRVFFDGSDNALIKKFRVV